MTNDNNKINELVSSSDDDPTAELEIPASFPDEREQDAQELEADASTFEFEQSQIDRELDGQSIAALKSGLKSRTDLSAAHAQKKSLTTEHVLAEIQRTKPLSVVMAEKIALLRRWAEGRTVACD